MVVLVGFIIVIAAVLGGFSMAGGHVGALIHLSEFVTIGGAALGALIVMSPLKVLKDLVGGIFQCLKGSPYGKKTYEELFTLMYQLFRVARRDGLVALEPHFSTPHDSALFKACPKIAGNHHVSQFICGALSAVVEGGVKPDQLPEMLEREIKVMEDEHHAPLGVLSKTADALPGFGIVAAVLGIVITMGAIDGPVEVIGHKVGAALVGTFLGILLSYGFLAPLCVRLELLGTTEMAFFRTVAGIIHAFANGAAPKVALEQARRGLATDVRLTRDELDALFKQAEAA